MVILTGFTAAVAQIVLLRELMVVFYGNEISIGLMLASWLLWTAAGSSLAGRLAARRGHPQSLMAAIQMLIAGVLPGAVLAVRAAKSLLQTVPGEVLGPAPALVTSLVVLGPFCLLSGALFTAASEIHRRAAGASAGEATGSVYLWEAVGSSAGGLAAGLVLLRFWGSLEIAWLVAGLNLAAACSLVIACRLLRYAAIGALVGIAALLQLGGVFRSSEEISQKLFWRGQHLVAARNSVYGNLAVVGTGASRTRLRKRRGSVHRARSRRRGGSGSLRTAGAPRAAQPAADRRRHQWQHCAKRCGTPPSNVWITWNSIPPSWIWRATTSANEWGALAADPRVRIHVTDGRLFLKTTQSAFDVVIVNLPDPQNAQLNRFYTVEFFREASRKLTASGVSFLPVDGRRRTISARSWRSFCAPSTRPCARCSRKSPPFQARRSISSRRSAPASWQAARANCWRGSTRAISRPAM